MTKSKRTNRIINAEINKKRIKLGRTKANTLNLKFQNASTNKTKSFLYTQSSTQPSLNQPTKATAEMKEQVDQMKVFFQNINMMILSKYGDDILKNYIEAEDARLISFSDYNDAVVPTEYDFKQLLGSFDKAIQHFRFSDEIYFLTSYIIDLYLNQTRDRAKDSNEFKLIGLTAFYIASKILDSNHFRVNEVRTYIGMNLFTSEDIVNKELDIVEQIDFDLQTISTYDIIQMMFSDCISSLQEKIDQLEIKKILNVILSFSVGLAKLIEANKSFVKIKISLKAIGCIIVAFDIFRSKCNSLSNEQMVFLRNWIKTLVDKNGYTDETLAAVYNLIQNDFVRK